MKSRKIVLTPYNFYMQQIRPFENKFLSISIDPFTLFQKMLERWTPVLVDLPGDYLRAPAARTLTVAVLA